MKIVQIIGLFFIGVQLSGCISMTQKEPAPVSDTTSGVSSQSVAIAPVESGEVQIRAYEPSSPVETPKPVHGKAVVSLLRQAESFESTGDYQRAVSAVERALRIEPRNAHLWNRLAHLRYSQKRLRLAKDMAAKSTTLAGADLALKRDNWLLIALARRASGDLAGARVAERTANQF